MPWKKICCGVDFSEPSWIAMEQAADVASGLRAELTLVHVWTPPPPAASDVLVSSRGVAEVERRQAEETLEIWRSDAEGRAALPVRARVLLGDPAVEIARFADEEGIDLVVLGTHGRTGLSRLVLGSVAERVLRRAPVPVLVIRDHVRLARERDAGEPARYA
ncbi:MAG TPA: universal stress protein [Anaeromyxobacter sp.]|nr:universal stress protein [Anaeromyxobacter sp.]